jgi:hypothetical protein
MGIISRARDAIRRYRDFNPEEAYLSQATSLTDLERRQRELDRNRFRRPERNWPY